MKCRIAVTLAVLAITLVAFSSTEKKITKVHHTPYGKFIQVGNTYYSSGIAARLLDGSVPSGMAEQTRVTLDKFQKAYSGLGLKMSDVVKVNVYLTDEKLKAEMDSEYAKIFSGDGAPCRMAVSVVALDPGRLVEMDMIAVK